MILKFCYEEMLSRFLHAAFFILSFPFYLLFRLLDEVSGEARWYRDRHRELEDRYRVADGDFVADEDLSTDELECFVATRRALALSIGVPADRVHPSDVLTDVWRMQMLGPDFVPIAHRLETQFEIRLNLRQIGTEMNARGDATVRDFCATMTDMVMRERTPRELRGAEPCATEDDMER